ncbi:SUMF1/EgtB/PvdO family nonheme iron enzyme, partial [Verrucomicrobiota bacterium]
LSRAGYLPLEETVRVSAANASWSAALKPVTGIVRIDTIPGVEVSAKSEAGREFKLGVTDGRGRLSYDALPEGAYRLSLAKRGYETAEKNVRVSRSKPLDLNAPLIPLPGRVRITSKQPAEIREDGRLLGRTGETIKGIPAGLHTFEVVCPGYRSATVEMVLPAGELVEEPAPELVRFAAAVTVDVAMADGVADPPGGVPRQGSLRVGDGEWQDVDLPYIAKDLGPGETEVMLRVPEYEIVGTNRVTVILEDGKTTRFTFRATPQAAFIQIRCNVSGAEVFERGVRLGAVGAQLAVVPFVAHELEVRAAGHKPGKMTLPALKPGVSYQHVEVLLETERAAGTASTVRIVKNLTLEMVWIPASTSEQWKNLNGGRDHFLMGSPDNESERDDDEERHAVRLTRGFWLSKYEVTQQLWAEITGHNPSRFVSRVLIFRRSRPTAPVDTVSWADCRAFITELNRRVPGGGFRLPTEAEWEYACRAGSNTRFPGGSTFADLDESGWYQGNSDYRSHPVGAKRANAWGLHDMVGNVWEWCSDWYGKYPASGMAEDPMGPPSGSQRVVRGGSCNHHARHCRSAERYRCEPEYRLEFMGFRLARTTEP